MPVARSITMSNGHVTSKEAGRPCHILCVHVWSLQAAHPCTVSPLIALQHGRSYWDQYLCIKTNYISGTLVIQAVCQTQERCGLISKPLWEKHTMRSTGRAELVGGTVCTQAVGLEKKTLLSECCRVLAVDIGLELPFLLLTCFSILLSNNWVLPY